MYITWTFSWTFQTAQRQQQQQQQQQQQPTTNRALPSANCVTYGPIYVPECSRTTWSEIPTDTTTFPESWTSEIQGRTNRFCFWTEALRLRVVVFFLAKHITPRIPWFVAEANTVMSTLTDVQSDSTSFRWKSIVGGWLFDGFFFCRIPSWRTCYTSSNGKSTIWRCISYWTWGYSIAMLVYQSVTCVDGGFSSPKQGLISPTYSWTTNLTIPKHARMVVHFSIISPLMLTWVLWKSGGHKVQPKKVR